MADECRSCSAPIRWALTQKGRRIPLDPDPVPDGNLVLAPAVEPRSTPTAIALTRHNDPPLNPDTPRYRSHFATCPNARAHRRNRP